MILGSEAIEGKKLTDFLTSSLKIKERETLEDYFKMVLTRQFDAKMLESINPIAEFTYVDNASGRSKILKTAFSTVDQGLNDYYVLGSMEDISATRELQWKLEVEAGKREEEMKALFQVIQIDPAVFGDFLDDTENEFDRINEILKDKSLSAKDAMVDIYQSVHAIKSNAVILGLDNFSGKLHELENTIKQYRDGDEVSFENVLHVAVELERIMKEKDRFRAIIGRIVDFQTASGGKRRQDRYVLVETLSKACEKAARSQEKEAAFIIDELDGSILERGPRRIIKEVLTQLVRNAVYHGIEPPGERAEKGKASKGTVRLSMTKENGRVHLKLSDDGRGLDFGKIREKALALKLLSEADANNANKLLKVIFSPGFSTADAADLTAGRGIGLNLVRDRVKELRGSIKISSDPDKGTTFHVYLPQ
jgi:two-component system chemotaxis sensor kinase CheA